MFNLIHNIYILLHSLWNYQRELIIIICCIALVGVTCYNYMIGKTGRWYTDDEYYDYIGRGHLTKTMTPASDEKGQQGKDSKGETECRRVLEQLFNKPFNKARPSFLSNPVTGGSHNLELDCFNKSLGIACEYNGRQHYAYIPFFHKSKESFYNTKYRDIMKIQKCKEYGIFLISVPYTVKIRDIESFILNELKQKNILP